ncbi:MAG: rhodanese-like domain-containing protein [Elusimicrobia bacterium]|nr:rhodanese-like domain-containing protein [Elusimicrobiota bacterium]
MNGNSAEEVILDVREEDEFMAQHAPGSVWVPLSRFGRLAPGVLQTLVGRRVLLMCRGGNRARLALAQIEQLGFGGQLSARVYEGGILEWARSGKPVTENRGCRLPILRQVQLIVGLGVLAAVLLSFGVDRRLAWVAAFFGLGLTLAGLTGFCPLAELVGRLPWNRAR